jgi:nucleotide-binding universal stress UspA family protein
MNRDHRERLIRPVLSDVVDLASEASFPASDAPSWTPVTGAGAPGRSRRAGVILHPTDFKESSRSAFDLACRLAGERGGRLVVLHVVTPPAGCVGMAAAPPLPRGYLGAWEGRLRMLRPRDPIVRVEYRLAEGDPTAEILRTAREVPCDLIVMGGRRRTLLGRLLARGVADAVRRKAPCPVLVAEARRRRIPPGSRSTAAGTRRAGTAGVRVVRNEVEVA